MELDERTGVETAEQPELVAVQPAPKMNERGIDSLLERDLSADYRANWTQLVAQSEEKRRLTADSIFIFRLGVEWMALPTSRILQVVGQASPHTIPHRREVLLGLVTVNGELVVCVSLARLLGIDAHLERTRASEPYRHFIVAAGENGSIAFPVDEVHGIHRYHEEELRPVPATLAEAAALYTLSVLPWQGHTVGCLDDEILFYAINKNLS